MYQLVHCTCVNQSQSVVWLLLSGSQSLQMLDIIHMIELEMARNQPLIDVCTPLPQLSIKSDPFLQQIYAQDEVNTYSLHLPAKHYSTLVT